MADNDVELCRAALQEFPRPISLSNLANSLLYRFQRRGVLSDIDEAIGLHRAVLAFRPPGHPDRFMTLHYLATSFTARFERQALLSDLDEAIELYRAALAIFPPLHSSRSDSLSCLAVALQNRFQRRGVLSDLDEAIELHRAALALRPPGHSDRSESLNNLANSLRDIFNQRGILSYLDEAIELYRANLALCPLVHSHLPMFLNNLASCLKDRCEHLGVICDLDEPIKLYQAALELCLHDHSLRPIVLNNLAAGFIHRFLLHSVPSDLDDAVELHREALALHPPNHPNRSRSLNFLASSLRVRSHERGVLSDLDEAIDLHRAALALSLDHSDHILSLNNLAISLYDRFQERGVLSELDEAIEFQRAALEMCPPAHPNRSMSLNNLSLGLLARFKQRSILSDLSEGIELCRAALMLCPSGHVNQSAYLNSLAASLHARFQLLGVPSDLDEAIELHRTVLALCPPGHSSRSVSLNNLALCLQWRFKQQAVLSDLPDLSEAIELHRAALALSPLSKSHRSLNNLANSLRARFQQRGVLSDINEAIEHNRCALALCPPDHPARSPSLNNLALSLQHKCQQCGVLSNLEEAIELYRAALALRPPSHSERSGPLENLALSLQHRFQQRGQSSDLDEVFSLYSQLSQLSHPASHGDIHAAKAWITSAEQTKHSSALAAYQTTLKFLDQYVAVLSSSSHHFDMVRKTTSSLAVDAFSYSIRHDASTSAVELVEQGRAVLWTQLARFRTPLDELSASGDTGEALAEEFKKTSIRLRNVSDAATEDQSSQIRQLTMQWDGVISRIRQLPDFSRFLLPPLFSDLQKAATAGPIIIVNASKYSCDALIVMSAQDPILIPLDISLAEVSELSSEFQSLTERFGSSDHQLELLKLVSILRKLWARVVGPVVQALGELIDRGSRIWWCPTSEFTLLPLHAAGPYEKKSHNLSHFYISSYTPTLAALIRARQHIPQDASEQHFVAVGQGNPEGGKELRCVAAELAIVAERVAPILSFTSLADSDATVHGASDAFSRNQWLHLACHGMPNRKQPFESSFAMRDGPFTIMDIIRSRLQNPEFAFLSACHTTVGDQSSPDEAINLAAAMQFSGFRSVIGSMWSVDDEVARQVVTAFYDNLVDDSGRLDCRRAAVALHNAVKSLRKKIPLEQQIVFVHIGV